MKNFCYVCGCEMAEGTVCCPHFEHIIPNAIGGHLTSCRILCEKCGGDYSKGDSSFVNIFGCFIHNMEHLILFDRGHSDRQVKGSCFDGDNQIEIIVEGNKAMPRKPIVEEAGDGHVKITANPKVAKQMAKKYQNEGKEVDMVDNLYGILALNFSEGMSDFNDFFKEGFVKIAVEYALHKGIAREQLDVALTLHDDNSASVNFDKTPVFPFVPMDRFNSVYELHRNEIEKLYPSHTLLLFNNDKKLLCYIDLFSTFQYYVLLGENYTGEDVHYCYYQPLFEQREPHKYTKEELDGMGMSDLHIVVNEVGIDYKDKTVSQIINEIVGASEKKTVSRAYDELKLPDADVIEAYLKEELFQEEDEELDQELVDEIRENGKLRRFRRVLLRKLDGRMQQFDYPNQCNWMAVENMDTVRQYTNMKYSQLEKYSNGLHFQKQVNDYLHNGENK